MKFKPDLFLLIIIVIGVAYGLAGYESNRVIEFIVIGSTISLGGLLWNAAKDVRHVR